MWLVASTLLFQRDLAPRLFPDNLNYAAVLADRAVEESTRWILKVDQRRVGGVTTNTRPRPDGSLTMTARVRLTANLLIGSENDTAPKITIDSEFEIGANKRLVGFRISGSLERPAMQLRIDGKVTGTKLEIESSGSPMLPPHTELELDPQLLVVSALGPVDRFPDLWVGRRWTTRVVNPISALLPGQNLLAGATALEVVQHEVTGFEILSWGGRTWKCYALEHQHGTTKAHSWVRQSDGRLLRQETPLGILTLTLELDPAADRWEPQRDAAW